MSLLKTIGPDESSGEMKEAYQAFLETVGTVPPPFVMYSSSPGIQSIQASVIRYYREDSNLGPLLMALIRYLTAVSLEMEPCVQFNARALQALGMADEQIAEVTANPATAPLDEKEGWLLAFVIKAVMVPDQVSEGHVRKLRDLGWTDTDIFDALHISCTMVGMERMMRALKFE